MPKTPPLGFGHLRSSNRNLRIFDLRHVDMTPVGPDSCKSSCVVQKRNDARTELTTSHRRSLAGWGHNDDAKSMTHPTDGACGSKGPCPRRGVHDSIRDGANRIDARERLAPRRRLDVFHSQPFGRSLQRCTLAQVLAQFLQKSFKNMGLGTRDWGWPRIGD
jgi:hypothetical protein